MVNPVANFMASLLERTLLTVYGGLWRVARSLLRRHKRLRDAFDMRLVPENWSSQADIWMQAASGGEAYLAWEWLKALLSVHESESSMHAAMPRRILLTSCTRQGLDVLHEAAQWAEEQCTRQGVELSIAVQVFPLDEPRLMRRAVRMVSPRTVVLLETELWPSLMAACRKASVPVTVLNGRMSPRSFGAYYVLRPFWQALAPRHITAISHDDAMRFSMLFGVDVDVVPNMKFDRLFSEHGNHGEQGNHDGQGNHDERGQQADVNVPTDISAQGHESKEAYIDALLPKGKRILLGSVREEEEALLVSTICQLVQKLGSEDAPTIIIAPRHMHRVTAWQDRLSRVGLPTILRSSLGNDAEQATTPTVIIWDTFGELGALYGLVHAVFVGGSLMPLGGQNFLEPLGKGLVPCVGPYLDNFAWVEPESLESAGLLRIVRTDTELAETLFDGLGAQPNSIQESAKPADIQERFYTWLGPRCGGAKASVAVIRDILAQ